MDINEASELRRLGMSGFINDYYPASKATEASYLKLLSIRDLQFDSNILQGIDCCIEKKYEDALNYFNAALEKDKNN
jgi:hypothetical protein